MTTHDYWPAPVAVHPIEATVAIPGSKSITNRALVLAALADGPATITNTLISRDTNLMLEALRTLGTEIEIIESTASAATIRVTPAEKLSGGHIDCGLAGTVMRFVPLMAALAPTAVSFDGDAQARQRPMGQTLHSLRELGVGVASENNTLPFTVNPEGNPVPPVGGDVRIDASASSQFVSGLLLVGARFPEGITVIHTGDTVPSQPHIDMTITMLRTAGVQVDVGTRDGHTAWTVHSGPIAAVDWVIEPDLSNATPFLAAGALTKGAVTVPHWPNETTQPGDQIREILEAMGANVTLAEGSLTIGADQPLRGVEWNMRNIGELTPTVAAIAALAVGPTTLSGVAHLRGHETDRLHALAAEINNLGGKVTETEDGLIIEPVSLHGGTWHSYADHRMATAGAILGLLIEDVAVEDIATTAKTMPEFPDMWDAMLADGKARS